MHTRGCGSNHALTIQYHPILACFLCLIHGPVRAAQQLVYIHVHITLINYQKW